MKKLFVSLALMSIISMANAQFTNKTMVIGGLTRSYRVYVSPNYNASNPASLLIALHGLGDNMTNFSTIGFNYIADTANIICIFPQAVSDPYAGTAWNSGAGYIYYPNATVDDVGFINALIDTARAHYSIDRTRVYLCGFSMGGFMTERMALQSNSKIAAFGSMSGTFGSGLTSHNPGRHVPIAHFHGTHDSTVYYHGDLYGNDPDTMVKFWVTNNACDTTPVTYNYPNTANDSITVERFEYSNGDPQSDVWFFKMSGAIHQVLFLLTNDISEPVELWLFLRRHSFANAGISEDNDLMQTVCIYPNPANETLSLKTGKNVTIEIFSIEGQLMKAIHTDKETTSIDVAGFAKGVYLVKMINNEGNTVKKFVKE